ncbi:hypothetical protein GCM10023310_31580 [Paenibacillus vulneris]|uniref:Rhodanese-like domain-containing protein n=1 Tax=Paenibacillus vulneris TaxID=1133364 RepID=A0ABW3UQ31_9BACL
MDVNLMIRIAVIALLVWFIYSRFAGVKGLRNLSTEQFREALQENSNNVLIDVREPNEVKRGDIPGAVNIPLSEFKLRGGIMAWNGKLSK